MSIEKWIDEVANIAGSVASHRGGFVKAFMVFKKAEIPEALSDFPCAITYGHVVMPSYSDSGPCIDLWQGITEFHVFSDVKKTNFPELQKYFGRIRNAFALKRRLGGLVDHCVIVDPGIELVTATYGIEGEHHALRVTWQVKENVGGEITLGQ
jgi:hypothetical protein